jgi:hypothetical protein
MSILINFDSSDADNKHFQVAIDQWQAAFDRTARKCQKNRRLEKRIKSHRERPFSHNSISSEIPETPWEYMERMSSFYGQYSNSYHQRAGVKANYTAEPVYQSDNHEMVHRDEWKDQVLERDRRLVTDNSPFGTGGWDPFHPSLVKVSVENVFLDCILLCLFMIYETNESSPFITGVSLHLLFRYKMETPQI